MKKILLCLGLIVSSPTIYIHAQNWVWAEKEVNGTSNSAVDPWAMCTDRFGNVFETGFLGWYGTWGTWYVNGYSSGGTGFFVKYDSTGNVKWAYGFGVPNYNTSNAMSRGVAADYNGNSYYTGYTEGYCTLGTKSVNTTYSDFFLLKLDASGSTVWLDTASFLNSTCSAAGKAVCVDNSNNIYVAGSESGTVWFGNDSIKNLANKANIFLARFSPAGKCIWLKAAYSFTNYGYMDANYISTDKQNNVYCVGIFSDSVVFGTTVLKSYNHTCMFLVKYDSNGNVKWARQSKFPTNASYATPYSDLVDKAGNIWVTGVFTDTIYLSQDTLRNGGYNGNAFIVKYDSAGNVLWARSPNIKPHNYTHTSAFSVAQDDWGMFYVSGQTGDTLKMDSVQVNGQYNGSSFILKMDANGHAICGLTTFNENDDWNGVAIQPNTHNIYFGGDVYWGPWYVGNDTLTGTTEFGVVAKCNWTCGQPAVLTDSLWASKDTVCKGDCVYIYAKAKGGTPGYKYKWEPTGGNKDSALVCPKATTTYSCIVTDTSGYSDTATIKVNTYPPPPASITIQKITGTTYAYTDTTKDPNIVLWYWHYGDGTNSTTIHDSIVHTLPGYGKYDVWLVVTDKHGCTDTVFDSINITPSGIIPVINSTSATTISPNPNHGIFQLGIRNYELGMKNTVEIYNMLGEKVYSQLFLIPNSQFLINMGTQPAGIYMYRVLSEQGEQIGAGKFVIQQ